MRSAVVVPFHCAVCGRVLEERAGGRCRACRRIVCRHHLTVRLAPPGLECAERARAPRRPGAGRGSHAEPTAD